ncbi:MAG TPA: chemotaxis protein CheA [Clostridiales bacterium]|nr:chemotaxis protein CheA [Clostridiales bacterium]
MSTQNTNDFVEVFVYETSQNVELLEQIILSSETSGFTRDNLNEIFRIVHTIKGSAAMMLYNNISEISHKIEDLFFYLREHDNLTYDSSELSEIVLNVIDFIKSELDKIKAGEHPDGNPENIAANIRAFLEKLKSENKDVNFVSKGGNEKKADESPAAPVAENKEMTSYEAVVFFEDGCQMENIRAFDIVHRLGSVAVDIVHTPEGLIEDDQSAEIIAKNGFRVEFKSDKPFEEIQQIFEKTLLVKEYSLSEIRNVQEPAALEKAQQAENNGNQQAENKKDTELKSKQNSIISVNIEKLDKLLDLAGELVIAEAMLTNSSDLAGLDLPNFTKTAQHLRKIIDELQDVVMSTRMVPLTVTFQKMNRIVHDMNKKLNKKTKLVLVGQETEVDKNIIEHISDPLMHLVRNAVDHGIEMPEERVKKGKPEVGTIILEARNEGSNVIITIKDDGKGFDKQSILAKAREKNLLPKPEKDMTDNEIYSLIFLPGFSTKDKVSEYSGRGVGMDVVIKNVQAIGGTINLDSQPGEGSTISIKIPLTLAIITGMNVKVGESIYSIPINEVKESFRPNNSDIVRDPEGNEMVMVRGNCYPIYRLHKKFNIKTDVTDFEDGIFVMVEHENNSLCLFVDELLGQQPVVVKALPNYILKYRKISSIAGCTLLGDGSISLILNVSELVKLK